MLSWPKARIAALERAGHKCEKCGRNAAQSGRAIEVHHRDKDRRNNDLSNLSPLCNGCHNQEHSRMEWNAWQARCGQDLAKWQALQRKAGREIATARKEAGVRQYAVAAHLGWPPSKLSSVERGCIYRTDVRELAPAILAAIEQLRPAPRPCLACGCVECECEVSAWAESHPGNDPSEE